MEFTKGEWKINKGVALVAVETSEKLICVCSGNEKQANAQLIANAPKMLETLNKVATFLKWQSEVDKTDSCINAYNDCIKVINQATKID
jgi:hypothetical protein